MWESGHLGFSCNFPRRTWCPWIYRANQGEGWGVSSVLGERNKGCTACGEFQTIIKLTKVSLLFIIALNNVHDKMPPSPSYLLLI